jgi:hypothetical protein
VWLDRVREVYGDNLDITWKSFLLEQVNSKEGGDWKVWDNPQRERSKTLLSLWAGEAARRQSRDAFQRYHLALLTARHGSKGRIPLDQAGPLVEVAEATGLDVVRFREDLNDDRLLENVARDHTQAVEEHGVFGTPTFVYENGNSAYLKSFIPPAEDSVEFFQHFVALTQDRLYVGELKRPQPPWPRGAAPSSQGSA